MDSCESTPLPPLTVLHTRRCSVFPKLYPIPKLFSFCLSLSVFLPCPATPNSKLCLSRPSQGLRFLSVLSYLSVCLVSFSPPGRTTTLFHSFSRYRHETDRIVVHSIPLRALLTKTKWKRKQNKREFTSIAASDQTKKSRCICIIVHTIQYIYTITPFVVVCRVVVFVFLNNNNQTCPSSSLP